MTGTQDRDSPLVRARKSWHWVKEGYLDHLAHLLRRLYGQHVPLEDVPLTQEELDAAMLRYGDQARAEVARGVFNTLAVILWLVRTKYPEITWESFGLSDAEARRWIGDRSQVLFRAMLTEPNPAHAVTILRLPYYAEWDVILGPGADSRLADAAIMWAKGCYAQLHDLDSYPPDALKLAERLCDLVGDWKEIEEMASACRPPLPTETIYSGLGFTYEDCLARLTFWERFVPD